MTAPAEMYPLTEAECLDLLKTEVVGRLVFTENALPAIRPVNFMLAGRDVVIRTVPEAWTHRVAGAVVAFEVDRIDSAAHTGWSVVLLGTATALTDAEELRRVTAVGPRLWDTRRSDHYLRIRPGQFTGRRLSLSSP